MLECHLDLQLQCSFSFDGSKPGRFNMLDAVPRRLLRFMGYHISLLMHELCCINKI